MEGVDLAEEMTGIERRAEFRTVVLVDAIWSEILSVVWTESSGTGWSADAITMAVPT